MSGCAWESSGGYDTDGDCGYGTTIICDDCKYSTGGGRKDPEAKCNQEQQPADDAGKEGNNEND